MSTLPTQPIEGAGKKGRRKKGISAAVRPAAKGKGFAEGDDVLLKPAHVRGYHATVTSKLGNDQYVVRIVEESHTGFLAQFSGEDLVAATSAHLEQHNSTRLD